MKTKTKWTLGIVAVLIVAATLVITNSQLFKGQLAPFPPAVKSSNFVYFVSDDFHTQPRYDISFHQAQSKVKMEIWKMPEQSSGFVPLVYVKTICEPQLPAGSNGGWSEIRCNWDGADSAGLPAPNGFYIFSVRWGNNYQFSRNSQKFAMQHVSGLGSFEPAPQAQPSF